MAGLGEKVTVFYLKNQDVPGGRWYLKDNFGEVLNTYSHKKSAVEQARQFSKDRAKSIGDVVKLVIMNKDDSVGKTHKYTPDRNL